jgi:hypothetical protein
MASVPMQSQAVMLKTDFGKTVKESNGSILNNQHKFSQESMTLHSSFRNRKVQITLT